MRRVRLRHPKTGATFDAPERAVGQYAMSGWVEDDQPEPEPPAKSATPETTGETEPDAPEQETPRRRRTKKES